MRAAVADTIRAGREAALGLDVADEQPRDALVADYRLASQVIVAAEELGWVRRTLVHWRVRRVVGRFAYVIGRDLPITDTAQPHSTLAAAIVADTKTERFDPRKLGGLRRKAFGDNTGNIDRQSLNLLNKHLSRIAQCR